MLTIFILFNGQNQERFCYGDTTDKKDEFVITNPLDLQVIFTKFYSDETTPAVALKQLVLMVEGREEELKKTIEEDSMTFVKIVENNATAIEGLGLRLTVVDQEFKLINNC